MIEQGSDAWFKARLGRVTASRVSDVIARTKSGYSTSRANYAAQLVAERLTGEVQESYTNGAMQRGIEMEPDAIAAYEFHSDGEVVATGFVPHPSIAMTGASPDGLVGDEGLVEVKCPNTATHIETLRGQAVPSKYTAQMQWQMACTGRKWCDFVSYDNRMPEDMRLFVKRVERDDAAIKELEKEIVGFLNEVSKTVDELQSLYRTKREPVEFHPIMAG